jgi:hypothetical protein
LSSRVDAKGGRLADLPLPPLQNMPALALKMIAEQMGAEKLNRVGRFYTRLGMGPADASEYTEDELRKVWRETSASVSTGSPH